MEHALALRPCESRKSRNVKSVGRWRPILELLEPRDLPSGLRLHSVSYGLTFVNQASAGTIGGFTPDQIRHAYGFDLIPHGDGAGTTIAIVIPYDHPTIAADLSQFDSQFGLPNPTLTVVNQDGNASPLPPPAVPGHDLSDLEASLDVQWSHAIAPAANILLVEANDAINLNLYVAAQSAARAPGVVVVSMSFGVPESSFETMHDSVVFTTPANHNGVTFVAASGDFGAPPIYPASSPNVLAVGATDLTIDPQGNYVSESGSAISGGGVSSVEPQPAYQTPWITQSNRTNPDVSYAQGPFPIYNSPYPGNPWRSVDGTSAGCPQWAALIAIADQNRALLGEGSLDGPSQTLPQLYGLPTTDFHEIVSGGSAGNPPYEAHVGYNLVTGRGSPRRSDRERFSSSTPVFPGNQHERRHESRVAAMGNPAGQCSPRCGLY